MTAPTITEKQFALFVRGHRGDYVGEAAAVVADFVESISEDRETLRRVLTQQIPPFLRVSDIPVAAPDGRCVLPAAIRVVQVLPAGGCCRIGHIVLTPIGWAAFHYGDPERAVATDADQLDAVIEVFVEHFATMRRSKRQVDAATQPESR